MRGPNTRSWRYRAKPTSSPTASALPRSQMAMRTAMGCAGSAVLSACLAVEPDAFRAAVAALVIMGVAGELAGEKSEGPGSFAVAIIDALHNLDGPTLIARAKVD